MFGRSDAITEILGVEAANWGTLAPAPVGCLRIRWRSGRRAQDVFIPHDVALALIAAIEDYWGDTPVHGPARSAIDLSAGAPT